MTCHFIEDLLQWKCDVHYFILWGSMYHMNELAPTKRKSVTPHKGKNINIHTRTGTHANPQQYHSLRPFKQPTFISVTHWMQEDWSTIYYLPFPPTTACTNSFFLSGVCNFDQWVILFFIESSAAFMSLSLVIALKATIHRSFLRTENLVLIN